ERRLLSPDEIARLEQYRFERDRDVFLATRVLVRTVLSLYECLRAKLMTSALDRVDPGRRTTIATGTSPQRSSGPPITPTWGTSAWWERTGSISAGLMFSPAEDEVLDPVGEENEAVLVDIRDRLFRPVTAAEERVRILGRLHARPVPQRVGHRGREL